MDRVISKLYEYGDLDWFEATYLADWVSVAVIWIAAWLVNFFVPVFERDFSPDDPLISHPHKSDTVESFLNEILALFVPMGCIVLVGISRKSLHEAHHGIVTVAASVGLAHLVTRFMKHRIGRLRPDFLARCKWDEAKKACAGKASKVLSGRKSFPSGHSSTAFSGFAVLSLWLAGRFLLRPPTTRSYLSTKVGRLFLTVLPLLWALFVAMSRMSDYRHHKEDVIVGSLIGITTSVIFYLIYWPNPFSRSTYRREFRPKFLYREESDLERARQFELTSTDDLPGTV